MVFHSKVLNIQAIIRGNVRCPIAGIDLISRAERKNSTDIEVPGAGTVASSGGREVRCCLLSGNVRISSKPRHKVRCSTVCMDKDYRSTQSVPASFEK